ncbi:MAG: tetratricopeptide repeat protein [Armatimonadota bacterium]|nr:tetratricopeptide repeat protein [Armatimonadota bacterium]
MSARPAGTVTFLFADIEGSTELLQQLGDAAYTRVLAGYRALMRRCSVRQRGYPVDSPGDTFFAVFAAPRDAVAAAVAMQAALARHRWPRRATVRARVGLHTGTAVPTRRGYAGVDVHRAARICAAGYGGADPAVRSHGRPGRRHVARTHLGVYRLRGLRRSDRLYQLRHPLVPAVLPPLRAEAAVLHNLPLALTSFVGREEALRQVAGLLADSRLVTLTGPGGVGKTRLALEVARTLLLRFAHGVWLVDLTPVTDPSQVPAAVAAVLRVREEPGRPMTATLVDALRGRTLLLVLDNCEHAVEATARLAHALLGASEGITILATSRERLGVPGEVSYPVLPLSLPDPHATHPAAVLGAEAVRLFVERARAALPGFAVDESALPHVVRIAHALDGIPLAVELAAAHAPALALPDLADRLVDRFRLRMAGGSHPSRHQTLQAALDWSHDLLTDGERRLLSRLSAFAGGFTLDAAESVCAWGGITRDEVVPLLTRLVNRSLVLVTGARYRLLDTVRQYAGERLEEAGEQDAAEEAHLRFYRDLAERAEAGLRGPQQHLWLRVLDADAANLATALATARRRPSAAPDALRLAASLWLYWYIRGYWKEGRALLAEVLKAADSSPTWWRGRALMALAHLSFVLGDDHGVAEKTRLSLQLCRESGDTFGEAYSLLVLGALARRSGRGEEAVALHEQSLTVFRQMGDLWGTAWALRLLAIVRWFRGERDRAVRLFEDSLDLSRSQGNTMNQAAALHGLGRIAAYSGDHARAEALLKEGLLLFRDLGDREGIASSILMLGYVAAVRQQYRRAVSCWPPRTGRAAPSASPPPTTRHR